MLQYPSHVVHMCQKSKFFGKTNWKVLQLFSGIFNFLSTEISHQQWRNQLLLVDCSQVIYKSGSKWDNYSVSRSVCQWPLLKQPQVVVASHLPHPALPRPPDPDTAHFPRHHGASYGGRDLGLQSQPQSAKLYILNNIFLLKFCWPKKFRCPMASLFLPLTESLRHLDSLWWGVGQVSTLKLWPAIQQNVKCE